MSYMAGSEGVMMAGWVPSLPQAGFGDNWDSGNQWIPNGSSGIPSENDYAWTDNAGATYWLPAPAPQADNGGGVDRPKEGGQATPKRCTKKRIFTEAQVARRRLMYHRRRTKALLENEAVQARIKQLEEENRMLRMRQAALEADREALRYFHAMLAR